MPKSIEDLKVVSIVNNTTYTLNEKSTIESVLAQVKDFIRRGNDYYEDGELIVEAEDGNFYGFALEVAPVVYGKEDILNALGDDRFAELFSENS